MAARFDLYDLTSAMVTPTAPAAPAQSRATATTTRNSDRLFRAGAYLLTFAGLLLLAALLFTVTPLARVDVDLTVPFLAVCVAALVAIAVRVTR